MRAPLGLVGLLLALGGAACAGAPGAFRYQPEKVRPGVVYHYTKSNRDGSQPWRLSVFVASSTRVDVLKWEPEGPRFVNVSADMDWTRFMPEHLEQRREEDGALRLVLVGQLAPDGQALLMRTPDGPLPPIPFVRSPTHVYGFDLVSLNLALRHLVDPARDFEVGLIDPNKPASAEAPGAPFRVGRMRVRYLGEEDVGGIACRKYELSGSALEEQAGVMWVARQGEHIVRVEHPVRTSTDWTDFRLELRDTGPMTHFAWEALKQEVVGARVTGGGRPD